MTHPVSHQFGVENMLRRVFERFSALFLLVLDALGVGWIISRNSLNENGLRVESRLRRPARERCRNSTRCCLGCKSSRYLEKKRCDSCPKERVAVERAA